MSPMALRCSILSSSSNSITNTFTTRNIITSTKLSPIQRSSQHFSLKTEGNVTCAPPSSLRLSLPPQLDRKPPINASLTFTTHSHPHHNTLLKNTTTSCYNFPNIFSTSYLPLFKIPVAYIASKRPLQEAEIVYSDEEDDGRKTYKGYNFHPSRETHELKRANDGIWQSKAKTGMRKSVSRAHFEAEHVYGDREYNDYMQEVQATRERIVDSHKEKWLEQDTENSDEDDGMADFHVIRKRDQELAKATTEQEKDAIIEKHEEKIHEKVTTRLIMFVAMWFVFTSVTYDTIDPDTAL